MMLNYYSQDVRRNLTEVNDNLFLAVERFLWPGQNLTEEFKEEFHNYITERIQSIKCCVLWENDKKLTRLIAYHNVPAIKLKEVIISPYIYVDSSLFFVRATTNCIEVPLKVLPIPRFI